MIKDTILTDQDTLSLFMHTYPTLVHRARIKIISDETCILAYTTQPEIAQKITTFEDLNVVWRKSKGITLA